MKKQTSKEPPLTRKTIMIFAAIISLLIIGLTAYIYRHQQMSIRIHAPISLAEAQRSVRACEVISIYRSVSEGWGSGSIVTTLSLRRPPTTEEKKYLTASEKKYLMNFSKVTDTSNYEELVRISQEKEVVQRCGAIKTHDYVD